MSVMSLKVINGDQHHGTELSGECLSHSDDLLALSLTRDVVPRPHNTAKLRGQRITLKSGLPAHLRDGQPAAGIDWHSAS